LANLVGCGRPLQGCKMYSHKSRMFSQASNAELQESNTRLESVTKAVEGMMECQVCFNQFDNKECGSVYLVPCRHMYADHNSCRTSYELVVCKTCANNSRYLSDICIHTCRNIGDTATAVAICR